MNYRTLTYERVELPPVGDTLPQSQRRRTKTTCPICRSPRRAAIEALPLSGVGLMEQHRQARMLGCRVSYEQYKYHMANHYEGAESSAVGAILSNAEDPLSTKAIARLLLADALSGIIAGDIKVTKAQDIANLLAVLDKREKYDYEVAMANTAAHTDIGEAYRQLNIIMESASEVMSEEQLRSFVLTAWERGLGREIVDVIDVPIYQADSGYAETDMSGALDRYKGGSNGS